MSFGLMTIGRALGEPVEVASAAPAYTADVKKIQAWGYRVFHRAHAGTGLTDLAVAAGQRALAGAGVPPEEVDLVVLAMSDIAEYLYWDPAAAAQARLGAHRAEAVLLNQACGSGVASFDTVAGKFATHPEYRVALIVAANRVCEAYWNRMHSNTSVSSDGAAAAVAVRGHSGCRWLATEFISDGRYADFFRLESGGALRPFASGHDGPAQVENPFDRLVDFFGGEIREMLRFVETIGSRHREVLQRACKRAGVSPRCIKRVISLNDNIQALAELAGELEISLDQTNAGLAMDHGHLGCADQMFCLEHYISSGELVRGDIVALISMGSGMHWVCTLLKI
jgi:3-oxoacyl-[acyl-carrier-protein] synthase III